MTCSGVKNRLVSRPNPYHLPEWPLPLFPRSCGESLSMCDCETHDGRETFVQINWCVEGEGAVSIARGAEHVVTPGDVFYSLPGEARKNTGRSAPWRLRWLTFDGPFAADFMCAYAYPVFLPNAGRCPEELFLEFERGLRENTLSAMRRLISLIAEILFLAADPLNGAAPENRLIRRFVEIVRDNYMTWDLDVNRLAEMLGVHRSTLSRIVGEKMRLSPGKYLSQVRIQRALSLLRNTELPVHEVAVRVGIPDPAHFARLIRSATGMTPGVFRRSI